MTENPMAATGNDRPVPAGWAARFLGQESSRWLVPGLALFALVFCAYLPVLPGSFIMDDQRLVTSDNPLFNGEFTPWNIWFKTDFTLSTLGFWLEWLAWGKNPAGYHAVNALLHGTSAVLLWRLLRRLKIPGAWLAGALFAVHPVAVNSVARIAELKNTLSLPFFLLSLRAWLQYEAVAPDRAAAPGRPRPWTGVLWYQLAFFAFLLAMLSKTSTVMLPVVVLALAYWQRRRVTARDGGLMVPFFLLAGAMGLMSVWFQKNQALLEAGQTLAPTGFALRLATAGKVFWFYLGKDLLPVRLNLTYPHWQTDPATLTAWLPAAAAGLAFLACWRFRRGWGRHGLLALGGFGLALFPVLGFFDSQFLVRWQVSDHLQYLPMIFPVSLAAAVLAGGLQRKGLPVAAAILLAALLGLAHQRAAVFATEEALMRDTLARNPAAADAHNDLGSILARRQDYAEAMEHFTAAARYQPADGFIQQNLGQTFAMQGRLEAAAEHYQAALAARPGDPLLHEQFAQVLARQGHSRQAMVQLQAAIIFQKLAVPTRLRTQLAGLYYQSGHFRRATAQLRLATLTDTNSPDVWNNLAWMLATCPDPQVRDGAEAVRCARQASQLDPSSSTCLSTLAAADAAAGQFNEAAATAQRAIQMQEAAGQLSMAALNRRLLALYQAGQAYVDQSQFGSDLD